MSITPYGLEYLQKRYEEKLAKIAEKKKKKEKSSAHKTYMKARKKVFFEGDQPLDRRNLYKSIDSAFSIWIKCRDNWQCQSCQRQFVINSHLLECAHFERRNKKATRWEPHNAIALCRTKCHPYLEKTKYTEHLRLMIKKFGGEEVVRIQELSNTVRKWSLLEVAALNKSIRNHVKNKYGYRFKGESRQLRNRFDSTFSD